MGPRRFVGLMSGTSLDGVDAAAVEFTAGGAWRMLGTHYRPYPTGLRSRCEALQAPGPDELHRAAVLGIELAHAYAVAVAGLLESLGLHPRDITAIGCHGQTIRHQPRSGYSLQVMNGAMLAERTGCTVICDFRSRDIAAGGQGAPLVPAFHQAAFGHTRAHRAIVNLGGIANVTELRPGQPVRGFDTGPGNVLMDAWAQQHVGTAYDAGGSFARSGQVITSLLARWLAEPYLGLPPPKSTGRDLFNLQWMAQALEGGERPQDVQATLLELSARTVAGGIGQLGGTVDDVYLCGGGARNGALRERLAALLAPARVALTDDLGLPVDWVEAVAFAWLACAYLDGQPGNLPEVTGAAGPRVLGACYPA